MTIEVKFTPEMIGILKSLAGQTLLRWEHARDISATKSAYGNIRLYFSGATLDLSNLQQDFPDFPEELSCFACELITDGRPYVPALVTETETREINRRITGIELIQSHVDLDYGETILEFHSALILNTDAGNYMFSRDAWFSEEISLSMDKDYDKLYPIPREVDLWENEDEHIVSVTRTRQRIA